MGTRPSPLTDDDVLAGLHSPPAPPDGPQAAVARAQDAQFLAAQIEGLMLVAHHCDLAEVAGLLAVAHAAALEAARPPPPRLRQPRQAAAARRVLGLNAHGRGARRRTRQMANSDS